MSEAGTKHNDKEVLDSLEEIFDLVLDESKTIELVPSYPEALLQVTPKGNKYFTAYQSHSRQFIDSKNKMVRWKGSSIENINNVLLEQMFLGKRVESDKKERKTYSRPKSSALFSWSSTDEYIETRKRQLKDKGRRVSGTLTDKIEEPELTEHLSIIKKVGLEVPSEKVMKQLNYVIDTESNKFIHERIQIIKSHHSQQILQMISERKRKDHEIHLQRLRQKEQEYEREMKLALEKDKDKGFGFLGIFNFNSDQKSLDNESIESKKRFSFLPMLKKSSTPTSRETQSELTKESELESKEEDTAPKEEEQARKEEEHASKETQMPETNKTDVPLQLNSKDIDLLFKIPSNDDEFAEFKSSPPKEEKVIKTHKLMPMSEPTPLINLGDL